MNAPTADILAFHRPAVNGEVCELGLNLAPGGVARIRGSVDLLRAMASAILSATGGSAAISRRLDESAPAADAPAARPAPATIRTSADRVARYERVAALVRDGWSWTNAGVEVGVSGAAAYQFFYARRHAATQQLTAAVRGKRP